MKLKRIMAIVLCLAMVLSTMSFNVFAEESTTAISGTFTGGLVNLDDSEKTFISADIENLYATESVVLKLFDADGTLLATTTLTNSGYFISDELSVKFCIRGTSGSWDTVWEEGKLRADYVPSYAILYVDGEEMNSAPIKMEKTSGEIAINWADVPGVPAAPSDLVILAQTKDINGNVIGEYADFESALAAACDDDSVARIEILGDITQTAVNSTDYYDITNELAIGSADGENYTVSINPVGDSVSVRVQYGGVLTIEENVTIDHLDVVANGFATTGENMNIDGTLKALSLKQWTNNGTITVSETGKVWLGFGDGQFDMAYGNGTVIVNGNGDETEPQFKAGYSGTRGNGNTLNLNDTYFEGGAWFNVNGSNGTVNIDNSLLKVSGGDGAGSLTVASTGNTINLTNGSTLDVANLTLGANNELTIDGTSQVKVKKLTGNGSINLDATTLTAASTPIVGDASEFEGSINIVNNDNNLRVKIDENGNVVLFEAPAPEGDIQVGYYTANYNNTGRHAIYGEATNVIGSESFVVELYSDDTLVGTSALVDTEKVLLNGNSKSISWHILLDAENDGDAWWTTKWVEGAMNIENLPNKVKLFVDGKEVSEGEIKLHSADDSFPIIAVVADENGDVQSFVAADGYVNNMKNVNNKFNAAVSAAESGSILAMVRAGSYFISTGNDITISGLVDGVEFDMGGAEPNMGSADVSFENVTFNWNPSVYHGLQYAGNMTYTNCEINGTVFLYGESETFNNCTFNVQDDAYNVWTYSAKKVDFNGCTFNSDGKSVLIYHEGATTFNDVTVTDCDFIANSSFEGKAAIEMDSSLTSGIKLTIDAATTATGFDAGNISGNNLWNNKMGNEGVNNDITIIVDGETVLRPTSTYQVATKAELKDALSKAEKGDTILLTDNIDYGTDHISIEKGITLDLGKKTLTTGARNYGLALKNDDIVVKNGKLNHAGTVAAIKVWNAKEISDLDIDVTGTSTTGSGIDGIVIQENAAGVDVIKNVKIYSTAGQGISSGIKTYNCGNATEPVIGLMDTVSVDANDIGLNISAPCGTATNCDIKGGVSGIEIWIKGNYSASLTLEDCTVTGGAQAVHAHDEYKTGAVNNGTLSLVTDEETTFNGEIGAKVSIENQHGSKIELPEVLTEDAVALVNGITYFTTLADALKAANDGDTVELIYKDGDDPIAMNGAVYGKSVTITGTATVDWSKGFLFVGRGGAGNGTLTFDNANLTAASNQASTGIHVSGREKDTDNKYDGTLIINNSTIELDYLINKGTITLDNSTLTVKNGFAVGGRPASETESGEDATATMTLNNNSKVVVNNHNGMGIGYEAIGIVNVNDGSTFEATQSFLVAPKGTLNINDGTFIAAGSLTTNKNVFISGDSVVKINDLQGRVTAMDDTTLTASYVKSSTNGTIRVLGDITLNDGFDAAYFMTSGTTTSTSGYANTVTIEDGTTLNVSYGVEFNGDVTLNGGTIKLSGGNANGELWGFVFQSGTPTINSDIVVVGNTGTYAPVHFTNVTATVNGSISHSNSGGCPIYIGTTNTPSTVTFADDAVITTEVGVYVYAGTLKSTGDVNSKITKADGTAIEISGGTYKQDVSAWCVNGYVCKDNGDSTYSVVSIKPDAYTVTVKASEEEVRYNNGNPDSFTVKYVVTGGKVIGAMAQYKYDNSLFTCAEDDDNDGKLILYNNDLTTDANGETIIAKLTFTVKKDVEVDTTYKFLAEKVQVTSDYDAAGSGAQDGFVENVVGDEVTVVAQWKVTLPGDNSLVGNTYVDKNTDYSATINNFDENMTYTIKYTMGDGEEQTIEVTKDNDVDGGFVIEDVTGDIVFTDVSYELNCEIVLVPDYVNGCTLVIVKDGVANGYTYDNAPMYPVARYEGITELPATANSYIVGNILNATSVRAILIEGAVNEAQARTAIKAAASEPEDIEKSFDVNGNGSLFFNDAMTAHGCYKEQYDLALELAYYLRADVDTDLKIRTLDYDATVGAILDELYGN